MNEKQTILTKILETAASTFIVHGVWGVIAIVALFVLDSRLDRAIDVLERMDGRVEQMFVGAAPVGKAIVEKGIDGVKDIDAKELADKATKRIGEFLDSDK